MARDAVSSAPTRKWPNHDRPKMARDFLFWRHLRVVRARTMRLIKHATSGSKPQPTTSVYGIPMWAHWSDKTYAYCHYGTYGHYLEDLLASIDEDFCFLDVGANQGLFSLIAARNPHCKEVLAMEPVAGTFSKLSANFELNDLGERGKPLNWGLSEKAGSMQITLPASHSGMATLGAHVDDMGTEATHEDVELITIKELDELLPSDLPIFVKIDVEGHEQTVIEQLAKSRHAQNLIAIFYEHDDRWSDAEAIQGVLGQMGFAELNRYGRGIHYDVLATPRSE